MYYQAIVKTPSNLAVLDVDGAGDYTIGNAIVGELAAMRAEWPEHPCPDGGTMMPGTRVHNGAKLNHVILNISSEDPLTLLEWVITGHGLDWEVMALAPLYAEAQYEWDEELEDFVEVQFDLDPTADMEPFLEDVFDGDGNPIRPTLPVPLHHFDGCIQLVVPAP